MDRSAGPPSGAADGRFRIPPSSGGNNGRLQVNKPTIYAVSLLAIIAAPGLPMGRPPAQGVEAMTVEYRGYHITIEGQPNPVARIYRNGELRGWTATLAEAKLKIDHWELKAL
jgi:hypothetical protein